MKLSRLYSNKPLVFEPIDFQPGLNVVIAEIRLPENQKRDTHNLGKTTLAALLDFAFLDDRNTAFFLFKHAEVFAPFVFFLEIQLDEGSFLTIRRGVAEASKISFKRHVTARQNFVDAAAGDWDHADVPFERAKGLFDGVLDWRVSDALVTLKADITVLERQRDAVHRLQALNEEIQTLEAEKVDLKSQVEADVRKQDSLPTSLFSTIRLYFSEIVDEVIDRKALLSVLCNQYGNPEFRAEILDETGHSTSADAGHSYRKLLCIAFDLAILRAHLDDRFPRFVYHDGVFESLELRKKQNLLGVLRQYTELGIQSVITLIDSDAPPATADGAQAFNEAEFILRLHDEGDNGLLFKMRPW